MNLIEAQSAIYSLIAKHLPDEGWRMEWNNAPSTAGMCKYSTKTLVFSRPIARLVDREEFIDTVTHEIAHAMVGPDHGHDKVWRNQHIAIGGTGARVWSDPHIAASLSKWEITCSTYGCRFKAHRNRISQSLRVKGLCPFCGARNSYVFTQLR